MRFCSQCGKELKPEQKFCTGCGSPVQPFQEQPEPKQPEPAQPQPEPKQSTPPPQTEISGKEKSKLPLFAIIGAGAAVAVIVFCIVFFGGFMNGKKDMNDSDAQIAATSTETDEEAEPEPTDPLPTEAPQGVLSISSVNTDDYPRIVLDVTASHLDALSTDNVTAASGRFTFAVDDVQQTSSTDTEAHYSIGLTATEPEDDAEAQSVKIASGGAEAEYTYEVPYQRENVDFTIHQIDTSNYPEISVFFTMKDVNDNYVAGDKASFFNLLDQDGNVSADEIISGLRTTKDTSNINITLALDRSGSMEESGNFYTAQETAIYFLGLLNYGKGDMASVVSFDDNVYLDHFFSGNVASLTNTVRNMYRDGMTALYDALQVALLETSGQSGSKCIVALTDGMDNSSFVSPYTVIAKANELGIPIYIIGLGGEDFSGARLVAENSGGYFVNIYSLSEINAIYDRLFAQQQQQMVVSYTVNHPRFDDTLQDIRLRFKNKDYTGEIWTQFQYQHIVNPNFSQSDLSVNLNSMSDAERAIYNYEHQFVKAVNSYDFNEVKDCLDPDGGLYGTQEKLLANYKQRGVKERLLYYRINSLTPLDNGSYEAVVNEQFYIQIGQEKASYKEFENRYIIRNTAQGYKVSELTDLVTLSDRSVDIYLGQ